jgi:hypothetical protein
MSSFWWKTIVRDKPSALVQLSRSLRLCQPGDAVFDLLGEKINLQKCIHKVDKKKVTTSVINVSAKVSHLESYD